MRRRIQGQNIRSRDKPQNLRTSVEGAAMTLYGLNFTDRIKRKFRSDIHSEVAPQIGETERGEIYDVTHNKTSHLVVYNKNDRTFLNFLHPNSNIPQSV